MEIRPLASEDLSGVLAIFDSLDPETKKYFSWTLSSLEAEFLASPGLGLWMDGRIRAFILFKDLPGACEIQFLATAQDCGRQGLMSRLLMELKSRVKSMGVPIWLEVHAENKAACRLYQGLGFVCTATRKQYYRDGGDALLMELSR